VVWVTQFFKKFLTPINISGTNESTLFKVGKSVDYGKSLAESKGAKINVKNFHGSSTTVVRAQNDTSKTAKINSDSIINRKRC